MIATHTRRDGTFVCKPSGVLDRSSSIALGHVVDDAMTVGSDIVIDLIRVRHIDASGLTAVFRCLRRVRTTGGAAKVINTQPQVRRWIELVAVTGATSWPARAGHDAGRSTRSKRAAEASRRSTLSFGLR
jgi:anti-anti-sigma factor